MTCRHTDFLVDKSYSIYTNNICLMTTHIDMSWHLELMTCRHTKSLVDKSSSIFKSSYDDVLRWMPQDLTDEKSTLVQVMAWCRQATNHYLNLCWPRSLTPFGVTSPNELTHYTLGISFSDTCTCLWLITWECIEIWCVPGIIFWTKMTS